MAGQPSKAAQGLGAIAGLLAGVVGLLLGRYLAIHMLIPLAAAFTVGWILRKSLGPRIKPMLVPVAALAGHGVWMSFAVMLIFGGQGRGVGVGGGVAQLVVIEACLLIGAAVWLAARPSLAAVVVIGLYELLALAVNVANFSGATVGTTQHKALLSHILLRVIVLATMIWGYVQLRRRSAVAAAAPAGFCVDTNAVSPPPLP